MSTATWTPRLIATDVDGTLITSSGTISARTLAVLEAAHAAGVPVIPVSGRQPFSIHHVVRDTFMVGPVVGANGAVGMDLATDEVLFEDVLGVAAQTELVHRMREQVPGVRCVSVRDAGRSFFPEHGYTGLMDPGDHGRWDDRLAEFDLREVLAAPSLKLILRHESVPEDDLLAAALALDVAGCHVTTSGAPFVEVSAAGVTKESGLAQLCARLGVDRADVIAFGDNRNDAEMLRWVGLGVAMGNGLPEAVEAADEVTSSNDEDGLANVLERFFAPTPRHPDAPVRVS